jgi:hypothetical protein
MLLGGDATRDRVEPIIRQAVRYGGDIADKVYLLIWNLGWTYRSLLDQIPLSRGIRSELIRHRLDLKPWAVVEEEAREWRENNYHQQLPPGHPDRLLPRRSGRTTRMLTRVAALVEEARDTQEPTTIALGAHTRHYARELRQDLYQMLHDLNITEAPIKVILLSSGSNNVRHLRGYQNVHEFWDHVVRDVAFLENRRREQRP